MLKKSKLSETVAVIHVAPANFSEQEAFQQDAYRPRVEHTELKNWMAPM